MRERKLKLTINRNLALALLVFLILPALIAGYTFAVAVAPPSGWFTDVARIDTNTFTAGTLFISADGTIINDGDCVTESTDCSVVSLEIENTGSKSAYARARLKGTWSISSYTNTATATATATVNGYPFTINISDSASYIEEVGSGSSGGSGSTGAPGTSGTTWFTDYDAIDPLTIVHDSGDGTPGVGESTPNYPFPIGNQSEGSPTVDGLFYAKVNNDFKISDDEYIDEVNGISDSERYELYAISALGSKIYTYLDESDEILYVAAVVSHDVNDNVFDNRVDKKLTDYMISAGWTDGGGGFRPLKHLVNSEEMKFSLKSNECTWELQHKYAFYEGEWISPIIINPENRVIASASSIAWNLRENNVWNTNDKTYKVVPKDVGGPSHGKSPWKSPFSPLDVGDVSKVSGYPYFTYPDQLDANQELLDANQKLESRGWEWSMVYEFAFSVKGLSCGGLKDLSLESTFVHHSPPKNGPGDEYFYKLTFIKEVSVDGKDGDYKRASNNPLFFNQINKLHYRFVISNSLPSESEIVLESLVINDDVIGLIFDNLYPITIPAGGSRVFYYPNDGNPENPVEWTDDRWENYYNNTLINGINVVDDGEVDFFLCDDSSGLWQYHDLYYYYKLPLQFTDKAILNVKVCPDDVLAENAVITVNSYVDAIQTSHEAALEEWSMGYFNGYYEKDIDNEYVFDFGDEIWVSVVDSSQSGNRIIFDAGNYILYLDGETYIWGDVLPLADPTLNKNGITNFKGWIIQR